MRNLTRALSACSLILLWLVATSCLHVDRPALLTISPEEGQEGTEVVISGTNFVDDFSRTRVYFGVLSAAPALITSITDTEIHVRVPSGALSGDVRVTVGGVESGRVPFRVIGPWLVAGTSGADGVTVFDTHTGLVEGVVPTSSAPRAIRFAPDGSFAWLLGDDAKGGYVQRFLSDSRSVDARVDVAPSPTCVAFDPLGPAVLGLPTGRLEAWIGHPDGTIEVVEPTTPAVRTTFDAGSAVSALELTTDGAVALALEPDRPALQLLDASGATPSELARLDLGPNPGPLILNPLTSKAYVLEKADAKVAFVDPATKTITNRLAIGPDPIDMVLSGANLYVLSRTNHTIEVLDATGATIVATIPVAADATRLAVLPTASETLVWVATESNVLHGYDQLDQTEKKTITVEPNIVAFRPLIGTTGSFLLAAHATSPGQLSIIDQPDTAIRLTTLNGTPSVLAVQP